MTTTCGAERERIFSIRSLTFICVYRKIVVPLHRLLKNQLNLSKNMEVQFVNMTKEDFLSKKRLHKFMPLENALKTLSNKELWFADPSTWKDPFEKRFLDSDYVDVNDEEKSIPYGKRTYCMCTTQTQTSEAYWNAYSQKQIGIEFILDRQELLNQLEAYTDSYDVYVGQVEYMRTSEIRKAKISEIPFSTPLPNNTKDIFVRLMLLKRIAYQYEDEIRLILIKKRAVAGDKPTGVNLGYSCVNQSLINFIILDPSIAQYTTDLLKETFQSKYGFEPFINPDTGQKVPFVLKSSLYSKQNRSTLIWDV